MYCVIAAPTRAAGSRAGRFTGRTVAGSLARLRASSSATSDLVCSATRVVFRHVFDFKIEKKIRLQKLVVRYSKRSESRCTTTEAGGHQQLFASKMLRYVSAKDVSTRRHVASSYNVPW